MLRFSRRPCGPCGSDTLHKGPVCNHCGANNSPPRRPESKVRRMMRRGDIAGVGLVIGHRHAAKKRAGKPADERQWISDYLRSPGSVFGTGRARTRV